MPAPVYTVADYVAALQALLPRGRAWPRDADAVLTALLTGLAGTPQAVNEAAVGLLVDAFPATADQMLPEWEAALGLPGIYGVTPGTLAGRQAAVVAALTDTGGQSVGYFITLAATLGYAITIEEFTPFIVRSPVNRPMYGEAWAHTWRVTGPIADAVAYTSTADVVQAVPGFGIPILEAVLGKFKPAHTVVICQYA